MLNYLFILASFSTIALAFPGPPNLVQLITAAQMQPMSQQPDTAKLLAQTWVLREQQRLGDMPPVLAPNKMKLTFRPDSTYQLVKQLRTIKGSSELQVVEEGRWTLDTQRWQISMQTTSVDARAILSTMMPRWQVEEVSAEQLVLQQSISGKVFLLFESQK